jgi:hypothetical protein
MGLPTPKRVKVNKKAATARFKPALPVQPQPSTAIVEGDQNRALSLDTPRRSARKRRPSRKAALADHSVFSKETSSSAQSHGKSDPKENVHVPNKTLLKTRKSLTVHFKLPNSIRSHHMSSPISQNQQAQPRDEENSSKPSHIEQVVSQLQRVPLPWKLMNRSEL